MIGEDFVVVSIDFDYFIGMSKLDRLYNMPDGNEFLPEDLQNFVWSQYYPKIKQYTYIDTVELMELVAYLLKSRAFKRQEVYSHESHAGIIDAMIKSKAKNKIEGFNNVYCINFDFHHDMYYIQHNKEAPYDCGNWGRYLKELYPNFKLAWVNREDSEKELITGEPVDVYEMLTLSDILQNIDPNDIDMIFLCRSNMWVPPHFDVYFEETQKLLEAKDILAKRHY